MKESTVEDHLIRCCERDDVLCEKTVALGRRGRPDRELTWTWGEIDLVELKRPKGGRYEPGQERDHKERARRGRPVYLLNTIEKIDDYFFRRKYGGDCSHLYSVPVSGVYVKRI